MYEHFPYKEPTLLFTKIFCKLQYLQRKLDLVALISTYPKNLKSVVHTQEKHFPADCKEIELLQ